jgi:hypothetical protein
LLGSVRSMPARSTGIASATPPPRLTFDWHENEQNMWRFVAARAKGIMARMRPSRIVSFMPELGPYNIDDYQSTHPTGGCVMGEDPESSVTTTYGQVWDTPNVFVTVAALFPQNTGANPTGTIGAVTYRTDGGGTRRGATSRIPSSFSSSTDEWPSFAQVGSSQEQGLYDDLELSLSPSAAALSMGRARSEHYRKDAQ